MEAQKRLVYFGWLAVATAVVTISLKAAAYHITGSVGLMSDALESGVNLITAVFALCMLTIAAKPPDDDHTFGHSKAEYLSSGLEGILIMVAALVIMVSAGQRLLNPQPLASVGIGFVISTMAALCNGVTGALLVRAGRRHHSPTLKASGHHLLTDVWTTIGVLVGVGIVALSGWLWLDSVIAIIVALHILRTGWQLVQETIQGLMDRALPEEELTAVQSILDSFQVDGVSYHALRSRMAGSQRFVSVHLQVPGDWTVQEGHYLSERIEREICQQLAPISVLTHIEPVEDPISWDDLVLNREFA